MTHTHTDTLRRFATLGIPADVAEGTVAYIAALNAAVDSHWTASGYTHHRPTFALDPAATSAGKYIRIVERDGNTGRVGSVHAFLVKATGEVVKPAGWQGPAKSTARGRQGQLLTKYNVADAASLTDLLGHLAANPAAIFGGYLYQ